MPEAAIRPGAPARLILASTSIYRRELLERLRLPFEVARPDVDEAARSGEPPAALAGRLAHAKAIAVAAQHPGAWALGSDQVADLDGRALGKPHARDAAIGQLRAMSGCQVRFHTALCLARVATGHATDRPVERIEAADTTVVHLRTLSEAEIARYVDAEQPLDCAGSFKCEGLGIALFDAIHSQDPTALIGLPLIATARLLRQAGFAVP